LAYRIAWKQIFPVRKRELLAPPFPRKASGSFDAVNFRAVMREPWQPFFYSPI
jgi:hypothetical protein